MVLFDVPCIATSNRWMQPAHEALQKSGIGSGRVFTGATLNHAGACPDLYNFGFLSGKEPAGFESACLELAETAGTVSGHGAVIIP
jgi:hypothetical protein